MRHAAAFCQLFFGRPHVAKQFELIEHRVVFNGIDEHRGASAVNGENHRTPRFLDLLYERRCVGPEFRNGSNIVTGAHSGHSNLRGTHGNVRNNVQNNVRNATHGHRAFLLRRPMKLTLRGKDGPLVVKLAGIAGGIRLYDEEIAAAVAAGFRVAALDISGDRRDDPAPGPLGWKLYAEEVEEAIDREWTGRAVVWGTSFGCLVALAVARTHPERVSGLLLSHPPDPLWRPRLHLRLLDWAERRAAPDLVARVMFTMAFLGLTSWEGLAPALWARLPALLRASVEAATPAATVKRKLELLFRNEPGLPPPGAAIPVEIISGAWDLVAPLSGARRLASRIPGARIHVVGHSGHAGAYTRPRAHFDIVLEALKRLA